jgi:phosphoribosylformylglycinamidine synthase
MAHEDAALFDTVKAVGHGVLPSTWHQRFPSARIRFPCVRAGKMDGNAEAGHRAAVPDRHLVCRGAPTCASTLDAAIARRHADVGETELLLIDLGQGRNRLGGSALAQVFGDGGKMTGAPVPDVDSALAQGLLQRRSRSSTAPRTSCSPTTTVPMAASSPRFAK